jgi:heavy metal translocating P-type ATPase
MTGDSAVSSLFKIITSHLWRSIPLVCSFFALVFGLILQFSGKDYLAEILFQIGLLIGSVWSLLEVIQDFLKGKIGSDLLAVLAVFTSVALGEHVAGLVIVLMMSGGEILEDLATYRASSVLAALARRMPQDAMRQLPSGTLETIPVSELAVGDIVAVAPHAVSPADGAVIEGHGLMDESFLTGEPITIPKAPGSAVLAGAVNGDTALLVEVTKQATDSRYAQIVKVIQESSQLEVPIRRLGDRVGAAFTPLALGVAFLSWWMSGDATRFLSVLVVATPCPLILSIPVAILGAVSVAARQGILIRKAAILELLPKCTTLILDKTGTLTTGEPALTEIHLLSTYQEREVVSLLASLEQYSRHPLARAVVNYAKEKHIDLQPVTLIREKPGEGLIGTVNNSELRVTGRHSATREGILLQEGVRGLECLLWINRSLAAHLIFRDNPRVESKPFVKHLAGRHGINKVMIVSGDRASEVSHLAKSLGITNVHAEISPEGKLALVQAERAHSHVVFVGDGINDAPALVASSVGIAFGEVSEVTSTAADAVVFTSSLHEVDKLMHLALRTRKIIIQSVGFGMGASILGIVFAAAGFLTPTAGAIVQELIDLISLGNSLRLSFIRREISDFDSTLSS